VSGRRGIGDGRRNAVALVCDRGFLPYAAYLAAAIADRHPDRAFDVVIVGPDLPSLPPGLSGIRVERFEGANPFAHRRVRKRRSHASYLCLMLPDLLPGYGRILYVDADVVLAGPIGDVFDVDLKGGAVAAVRDSQQWRTPGRVPAEFAKLGLGSLRYLNSGVLLFDVARWRAAGLTDACIAAARDPDLAHAYARNDQSAINLALRGRWTELSPVWNWQWTEASRYFADDAGARLIHFIGPRKPWKTATLPPRFTAGYAPFLSRHFPEAPRPPPPEPQVGHPPRALLKHWWRLRATRAYLARFPDPLSTTAPARSSGSRERARSATVDGASV
jgi:hypothetical protein